MLTERIRILKTSILVLAAVLTLNYFGAYIETRFAKPTDAEFVDWKDLRPGQTGFGLTVFKGIKIERFYVTFDNVTNHPYSPREKVILVRMGRPLKGSNVLAGMSGSPVYFKHDGKWKLAGALAFSWGNLSSEEALGGVTPIQLMVDREKIAVVSPQENLKKKLLARMKSALRSGSEITSPEAEENGRTLSIISPQITILKSDQQSADNLQSSSNTLATPKPGEAVSMMMVDGDYQLAATCTVTYVRENEFWACGHPFLNQGAVHIPATRGIIATSFKSPINAFKELRGYGAPFGFIDYDSIFAVRGRIQNAKPDAAIKTKIYASVGKDKTAALNLQVIKDNLYAQIFVDFFTEEFLDSLWPGKERATVHSQTAISFKDRPPFVFNESSVINSESRSSWWTNYITNVKYWPTGKSVNRIGQLLNSRWNFLIESIETKIHIEPGERILVLDSFASLDQSGKPSDEVDPGGELRLVIGLKASATNEKFVVAVPLKIPKDLPLKRTSMLQLFATADLYLKSGNHFQENDPKKLLNHEPENPEEFLQQLSVNERDHQKIYIQLVLPPTETKNKPAEWPKLPNRRWVNLKDVSFLRQTKPQEIQVITQVLDSPLPEFLLDVNQISLIKINLSAPLPPPKKEEKLVPERSVPKEIPL